jgi:predicted dehydrogenase
VVYGSKGCLRGDELFVDGRDPIAIEALLAEHATAAELERLFPKGIRNPFARAYLDFLEAIRNGTTPSYDGVQGLTDLAWSAAVVASSRERIPQTAEVMLERARRPQTEAALS